MSREEARIGDAAGDTLVTPQELKAFIEYIDDNSEDSSRARLGKELEFMERNGLDSHRLLGLVGNLIKSRNSPILDQLKRFRGDGNDSAEREAEFIRATHLQLRDHYRRQFGLPPLLTGERRAWPPEVSRPAGFPRSKIRHPGEKIAGFHVITDEEARDIAEYMRQNFPDVVRYYREILLQSESQGYVSPDDIGRTGLLEQLAIASAELLLNKDHIAHVELVKNKLRGN